MAAFQFPDPTITQTVVNPITGSTYQWKEPPGKWVVTTKLREVSDIIWEGDTPPSPVGDYKLWYSTDTLELYFYYCDAAGICAWVPTSAPITMLEDLDVAVSDLKADVYKINIATLENENQIGRTIYFGDTAPPIYDDVEVTTDIVDVDGVTVIGQNTEYFPNELNYKFWFDDSRLELLILFKDADGDYSYMPVSIPLESLPEPGVSQETFTYTTGRLQTAIEENYLHNLNQDAALDDRVKKTGGDEMQGPFKVQGNPNIPSSRDARRIETFGVFSGSENTALRFGTTRDRIYVGHDDTSFNGLVKIDRIAEKNSNNGVKFENDIKMGINQIKNLSEATDDRDAVNYGQVKEELEELRDKIVGEVSLGTWKFDNVSSGVTPLAGCFITKKDSSPPQLSPNDINVIRISDEDVNGNPGVFNWEIGDLLTFTNVNNTTQSIKFRVNGTPANNSSYWIVSVAHITSNYDFFQNAEYYLSHISVDVNLDVDALDDTYLRLDCSNDPLESELEIKTPDFGEAKLTLNGKRDNTNAITASIAFESQLDSANAYAGYLTYRTTGSAAGFFEFNQDVRLDGKNLEEVGYVVFNEGGEIRHNSNRRITFKGASDASAGSGLVQFERPGSNGRRGITIRGKNTDNEEDDLLYTYTFQAGGDAIGYKGRILNDNHITNKKYVDDAVQSALPVDIKAIQVAGLQLGHFKYRRSSDSFVSGSIHSNTTTNPKNITQLDIWHTNVDGTIFGKDFYELYIVPKMFVHIKDNGSAKYVGKITAVDSDALTNGVRLTLAPLDALTEGSVYYNNQYDVSIGYNRYID